MLNYDVAIIGGGPGGSTCGSILKTYRPDLTVTIFERDQFPRDHVGESQLPGIGFILSEIGVWDKMETANFPIKIGATYRWGITDDLWDFHFIPDGNFTQCARPGEFTDQRERTAWQVDRSVYDKILLDHAADLGCEVRENTAVQKVESHSGTVDSLTLDSGEQISARYYVDASGNSGILRRALGVEIDEPTSLKNVAFWDYWLDAEWAVNIGSGTRVQIMSVGYGWLWFIPISPTRSSCGLVCPADYYKQSGLKPRELYEKAIRDEPRIRGLLAKAIRQDLFATTKDWSFIAKKLAGPNWFLVGESAGFADPILSAGMFLTHSSAREAAYTMMEIDRGEIPADQLRSMYELGNQRKIDRHIRFANYWYTANSHFGELKEFTREIAKDAGLNMTAEEAFQWLGTGGFLEDGTGRPGLASFSLGVLKDVTSRLAEGTVSCKIDGFNHFIQKFRGMETFKTPNYASGKIQLLDAGRRDGKILPLSGLYGLVVKALLQTTQYQRIAEFVKNSLESERKICDAKTQLSVLNILEAMTRDGWVKPIKLDDGSPAVNFGHEDVSGIILANQD